MRFKNLTLEDIKHLNRGMKVGIDVKLKRSLTDINSSPDLVFVFSKGAPDQIFEICKEIFSNNHGERIPFDKRQRDQVNEERLLMENQRLKVIMFAVKIMTFDEYKKQTGPNEEAIISNLEQGSTLIGSLGIEDPIKKELQDGKIQELFDEFLGVQTIICTGDGPESTKRLGKTIKFIDESYQLESDILL